MAFVNLAGLQHFYEKIKEKFVLSVNNKTSDDNGNIMITSVPIANNVANFGAQLSNDEYNFRLAGGNAIITSTDAKLLYLEGNTINSNGAYKCAKPASFVAVSFNQCAASSFFNGAIISDTIASDSSHYIYYCKAVGSIPNGYVAYASNDIIENIGWCASSPTVTTPIGATGMAVDTNVYGISFATNGYLVVETSSEGDICIHPRLDDTKNSSYTNYTDTIIALPTQGILNNVTTNLPSWGMAKVHGVADRLDLENNKYIQRIGRTTIDNETNIQSLGVDYIKDNEYIYYVLPTPNVYILNNINNKYNITKFGTEAVLSSNQTLASPMTIQTIYGDNSSEPKKLVYTDCVAPSSTFTSAGYSILSEDFPYRGIITNVNEFTATTIPEVIFGIDDTTSGNFAPIANSYNGGVYIYSAAKPTEDVVIPTLIGWRSE